MNYDKYKEELNDIKKEEYEDKNFSTHFEDYSLFEKPYIEKRVKLNNKHKVLFKHELSDAWMVPINKIIVLDKKDKNIIITYGYHDNYKEYSISADDIKSFKSLLMNKKLYSDSEILFPPILDGASHQLYFSNFDDSIEKDCYNIWYWNGNDLLNKMKGDEKTPQSSIDYTKMIIKIINQLQSILDKNNIKFTIIEKNEHNK